MDIKDFKEKVKNLPNDCEFKELPIGNYILDKDESVFINIDDIEDISWAEEGDGYIIKINGEERWIEDCCDFITIK